jgi:hypothetical protein
VKVETPAARLAPCCAGHFPDLPPLWPRTANNTTPAARVPPPRRGPRKSGGHDGDYGCKVPVDGEKRCPQCWRTLRWPDAFGGHRNCSDCRAAIAQKRKGVP